MALTVGRTVQDLVADITVFLQVEKVWFVDVRRRSCNRVARDKGSLHMKNGKMFNLYYNDVQMTFGQLKRLCTYFETFQLGRITENILNIKISKGKR